MTATVGVEARAWAVLCGLPRAREVRPGRWAASCPVVAGHPHGDRSAALRFSLGEGGVVLIRCLAGHDLRDIVNAVGLKLTDLWPDTAARRRGQAIAARAIAAPLDPYRAAVREAEFAASRWLGRDEARRIAETVVASVVRRREELVL